MLFSNVVGQQAAKEGLLRMWHNDLLPHALLITGAEGTGGLPMGLALAQYIFCENRSETDSCGRCPGCSKTSKLEHADLHISMPTIPPKPNTKAMSKHYMQEFREFVKQSPYGTTYDWLQHINAENKQGNITAEECNEIIDGLNLRAYEGGKKVLLMWRPEYLGKEGNKLLKLIEEPPADTILIFIAEQTEDILPTILSRTQEVKLAPIPPADIALALSTRSLADPTKASQIAHIAMGSYTEAIRILRTGDNDLFPAVKNLFNVVFVGREAGMARTGDGVGIAKFADEWSKAGREQQKNFLTYLIQLLEQAIRARYMPSAPIPLPTAEAEFVQRLAGNPIATEGLADMVSAISDTIFFIERNAHSRTQLHALALRMLYIVRGMPSPVAFS